MPAFTNWIRDKVRILRLSVIDLLGNGLKEVEKNLAEQQALNKGSLLKTVGKCCEGYWS